MPDKRYNVVFRGEVLDSFTVEQVKKNVAQRFKRDTAAVERLFSGGAFALARALPAEDADRLSRTLQNLGALVYIEEVPEPVREDPLAATTQPLPADARPAAADASPTTVMPAADE
ncbi:MAG: hypothetical protein MJE66_12745, partial [Proteobacteria bacterium]|nr:hypothetical protein [Pseudomonadota bacterium]